MAESQIQTTLVWNTGNFKRKQTSQIQIFVKHAHPHALTHIIQCQIKITQGHFQGCIYNHNDKYSIFEVAEVKEQTTAQAKKQVLALTPSPLFGDTLPRAQGRVEEACVPQGMKISGMETWLPMLQRSSWWETLSTTEDHGLNHCVSAELWWQFVFSVCGSSADSSVSRALKQVQLWQLKMLLLRAVCPTSPLAVTVGRKVRVLI